MSNYLTVNYFNGELCVPNITGSAPAATANANTVKWFIAKYEPKFLELLLGEALYAAFLAGMTVTAPAVPAAKWTALKSKIYSEDSTSGLYLSPAASYVYYHIMRDRISMTTSVGEVKPDNKTVQPQSVNNVMKMVLAWNSMADDAAKIWEWLELDAQMATYVDALGVALFDPYQDDPFGKINMFNI